VPTNGRRAYATAAVALLVGAGLLLLAYGLTWATAEVPILAGADRGDTAVRTQAFTGRDLYPGAAAMAWVVLAAVGGIVASRSWGRTVVAVLALLAGLAAAATTVTFALAPVQAVDRAVSDLVGTESYVESAATSSWLVALGAGLVVVVAAGWTAVRGRRWPTLGRRYERRSRAERAASHWEAQDLGQDPTDDLVE